MDTPHNVLSTFPTRKFNFILDPTLFVPLRETTYRKALDLVLDLKSGPESVDIYILTPLYLLDTDVEVIKREIGPPLYSIVNRPKNLKAFKLDADLPQTHRLNLLEDNKEAKKSLSLLALAEYLQADGVITATSPLIEARYSIYQHHRIRIIPLNELSDIIEICAHGHSIFWSASNPDRTLNVDSFYQLTHWKNSRLFKWLESIKSKISNDELKNNLHAALLLRHPFILYSRDMVRFYELQNDFYYRRGMFNRFFFPLGYHVNNFYFHLWGMLEQFTLIAKYALDLKVTERECGIRSENFWKKFSKKEEELAKFIKSQPIDEWISIMADMRHLAAHKAIQAPAELVIQTEDSKKSDNEILKIVRKENADVFKILPEPIVKILESQMIYHWRMKKMKRMAHNIVYIKRNDGEYFRSPVGSIDYDLARLTAVMDAFLTKLFFK